ncbi:hypothetical protein [Dyadobacter sandarakinus]|uniref:Uncharacterized protein n=1 Tax=Dyadobacter sandarakinus TaxID=2747268 RepID=A0ABX7I469_9BACT|nr:hypothetical protein [Dyadobacter sandarakinus]QRR00872.1 hypothetical protein HWI92_08115 [Dyadobacter sandarakinus]
MNQISHFLGQPWWQGVSVILAVVGLILAAIQLRKKKLGYIIQFSESVFAEDLGLTEQLSISYKGEAVKALRVASVKIKNYGFLPIKSDDFHEGLEIRLNGNLRILDCEIKPLNPRNLKINHSINNQSIIIHPTLLNSKDTFLLKVIYDGEEADIEPSCRIVGVSRIKNLESLKQATKHLTVLVVFATIFLYTFLNWIFLPTTDNYGYQVFIVFILLVFMTYSLIYKDRILSDL